ncbi:MAG: C10 family peptidase [Muribaculaceae bacterium]|nr:C10 family peptidase [Muribaculaceae bacterium]
MKKFYLSILAASLISGAVYAAPISPQTARMIAEKALKGKKISTPLTPKGVGAGGEQPYYVFNAEDGNGGYAIVAGDDRLPQVLGYSEDGYLDLSNAPEALIALLNMSVASANGNTALHVEAEGTGSPVVSPLLKDINWGQDVPFNTLCPKLSNGSTAYVGCVATAMAQMMRYYQYPEQGMGTHSYTDSGKTLSADFGATTYDWANMPAAVPESPTAAQTSAYSTLSYQLGVAVDMQYAAGGSGAYTHLVAPALRNYFGYSPELRMHTREYYNTEEWMRLIRTELDAGRPVYYSATSEDMLGGHAFVCDGYDSEGYVHINWGWYGRTNGYFYINHLNPGELGEGGGSGAYNISQEILTGFKPAAAGDVANQLLFGATRMSCDIFGSDMTVMTFIENLDTDAFSGDLYVVLTDAEGKEIVTELYKEAFSIGGFKSGHTASEMVTLRNVPASADVPDGDYRIRMAYRANGESEIKLLRHPIGLPSYVSCTVKNKQIVNSEKHVPAPNVTMLTALSPDGEIYANGSARFSVELKNNSDDFRLSSLVLTLKNVSDPSIAFSNTYPVNIYDLSSQKVVMDIDIPENIAEGEYEVVLTHDKYADKPFATFDGNSTFVTILPEASTPVLRFTSAPDPYNASTGLSEFKRGELIYADLALKNYGATGSSMIIMRATDRNNADRSYVIKADNKTWAKAETATVKISNSVALDPGTYDCKFTYMSADGHEVEMNSDPMEIVMTESASPAVEITEFVLPDQMKQGVRGEYSITLKALRNVTGTLYIRARQFTYTNGELIYMGSLRMSAGETKTLTGMYSPSSSLSDGNYLTMVEVKEGTVTAPAAGHSVYYKEFAIGETHSAVEEITDDAADTLVEWYTIDGMRIAEPSDAGIYIRKQGSRTSKHILR